jgi:thymidine kinase
MRVLKRNQPLNHTTGSCSVAKLYFRYGAVGSAKTLNLLAAAHSYNQQNKTVLVIKPELDTRFGRETVKSRAGLERDADLLVTPDSTLPMDKFKGNHCILVDEAQFLSQKIIEQLRRIATELDIPVICYGLRTDFRSRLFPGAQRLMELADDISEVKTTCAYCNRKGVFNLKLVDGKPSLAGPVIELGSEEKYLPTCAKCYNTSLPGVWNEAGEN